MNHVIQNKLGQDSKSVPTKYEARILIIIIIIIIISGVGLSP
jgi:hypothetical protein